MPWPVALSTAGTPTHFLDPGKLTTGQFVLNIAGLLTVVIAIALALILLDRVVGALQRSSDVRGLR